MPEPKQNMGVLAVVLTLWVMAFGWSVFGTLGMLPTGDGFTRGLNRVTHFLGWQAIAACLALASFGISRAWPKGSGIRVVARVPLWVAGALVAALVAVYGWAMLQGGR